MYQVLLSDNLYLELDYFILHIIILSRATFPGAPSYGGVKTWVEGSQMRGDLALADASNLLVYKKYNQQDFPYVRLFDTGGYKTLIQAIIILTRCVELLGLVWILFALVKILLISIVHTQSIRQNVQENILFQGLLMNQG